VSEELWQGVLVRLRAKVNAYTFSWIQRIEGAHEQGGALVLRLPDRFMRDWIDEHYKEVIQEEAQAHTGHPLAIEYEIDGVPRLPTAPPADPATAPVVLARPTHASHGKGKATAGIVPPTHSHPRLHDRHTFENLVISGSNQLAAAAAEAVGSKPGVAYNPLFIHGSTGLGKTHLLHAIGHRVLERKPDAKVVYVSSEEFTNEFISRVRDNRMSEFRLKYRDVDVLLIDDVQFLGKKEATQEEFFHTFNALHDAKKALVLTSDTMPSDIAGLEPRLKSRFQSGLIADINEPDLEMRCAILKKKAKLEHMSMPDDVAVFLAQRFTKNVRELEGALVKVAAVHSLTGQPVTMDLIQDVLRDMLPVVKPVDAERIQKAVAQYFQVTVDDLRLDRRHKQLAHARQVAMFLCRKLTRASFPELGARFNKDHTTVLVAVRKIDKLRASDEHLRRELNELEGLLLSA
jgi:chromosomal replication initiator protein